MTRCLLFVALTLLAHLWIPIPGLGLSIGLFFAFRQLQGKRKQYFLILILMLIRCQINPSQATIHSGRVVELNASSVVIMQGSTKVLVKTDRPLDFGLSDILRVSDLREIEGDLSTYGFNSVQWAKANGIAYQTSSIIEHKPGSGFFHWISRGGNNKDPQFVTLMRSILFQTRSESFYALAVSSGILFTSIFITLNITFKAWLPQSIMRMIHVMTFLFLGYNMGWPLALQRIGMFALCRVLFEDQFERFSWQVVLMVLLNPVGLSQMSWALPLSMELFGLFGLKRKRKIQSTLAMAWILSAFNLRFHWLELLMYPMIRKIYACLILLTLVCLFGSSLNPFVFQLTKLLDKILVHLQGTVFQNGRLTLVSALFIMLWFMAKKALNDWQWQGGLIVITSLLIPFCARPWVNQVTLINVGQGDAILIQSPLNQSTILIDTGASFAYGRLKTFLDAQAIKTIDVLILTHSDSDHSANRDRLSQDYAIHDIVTSTKDIHLANLSMQAFPLEIVSEDENDTSLVYGLNMHDTRFLFLADIPVTSEQALMDRYPGLKTDILKIAHHGSKTSTSDELLGNLEAKVAWISVGANLYGHPSASVLKRLHAFRLNVLSTFWEGDIQTLITPFFRVFVTSSGRLIFF